jgi:AraC-like DNA-binding protein
MPARVGSSFLLSVRMPPLGAYRVLGLPMAAVADDVVELDDVLGDQIRTVHQQLGEMPSPGHQFAALCNFVRRRLASSRVRLHDDARAAVTMLERSVGSARIDAVCRSIGVSRKHLRQLFSTHVGLGPKAYARMLRFRALVDLVQTALPAPDWAQIAATCGYHDQPISIASSDASPE